MHNGEWFFDVIVIQIDNLSSEIIAEIHTRDKLEIIKIKEQYNQYDKICICVKIE